MQLRPLITTLVLSLAILDCYGDGIISFGPPPPPPPSGAPVAIPGPFITDQYTPVLIPFPSTNTAGDAVTYTATAQGGTVEVNGAFMTYTPDTNQYFLGGSISFTALDTVNNLSSSGSVTINFIYIPGPPIINFTVSPLINNFPGATNPVIIVTSNGASAAVTFDDAGTVTRDDTTPYVEWYEGTNLFGGNIDSGWISEGAGVHTITLWATDNLFTNSVSETFEVITPSTAAMDMENFVEQQGLSKKESRPLKRILSKAAHWADLNKPHRAYN